MAILGCGALSASFTLLAIIFGSRIAHATGVSARPFFVFGSSYVDNGNVNNPDSARSYPWSKPYGETWPGRPSGRYGNGHVLSDVIAATLNLTPPVCFAQRRPATSASSGFNFATGGSGVLSAYGFPPISSQIETFQSVASSYSQQQLASAVALYATAGDDYLYYLTVQNAPLAGVYPLTVSVGKQISADLIRLYQLGLRKFAVTYLPPTGCLPLATIASAFKVCNDSWSASVAQPHNARVFKNVLGLRHYFRNGTIVLLDLYAAFNSAQSALGSGLKPCCVGTNRTTKCSNVGARGMPTYSVCTIPNSQFYWDDLIHPTEAGWQAVVKQLGQSLLQLK